MVGIAPVLRDFNLTRLRRARQVTFNTEAIVMRKSYVSDGGGGQIDTYTIVGTYPCTFAPAQVRPLEREREPGLQAFIEWRFVFAYGTVIRQTDRLLVGSRTFEVVGQGVSSYDIANNVSCLEIL